MYLSSGPFNLYLIISMLFRFIGSAKISLRDLATGQTKSLPSRNIPLFSEKKQEIGVDFAFSFYITFLFCFIRSWRLVLYNSTALDSSAGCKSQVYITALCLKHNSFYSNNLQGT